LPIYSLTMNLLLSLARAIDWLNGWIGRLAMWLVLAITLISAGNAVVRKVWGASSNAWLEIQWYLFAAVFMLGAGYAFMRNAHVRIDFVSSRFSARQRNWIDVTGILLCLTPFCLLMIVLSWDWFVRAWVSGEVSSNAGGLVRWPVYGLVPLGFALLLLQGCSELVKRVAFLSGRGPDPLDHTGPSATQLLARDVAEIERLQDAPHPGPQPR